LKISHNLPLIFDQFVSRWGQATFDGGLAASLLLAPPLWIMPWLRVK